MVLVEREVVHKMARTLSGLLDRRHVPAWHDLTDASRRRVTLDKLMSVTEEMGFVISKMSKGITRDVSDDDDDESDEKRASRDEKTNFKSSEEDEERKGPTYIVTPNICKILMVFFNSSLSISLNTLSHGSQSHIHSGASFVTKNPAGRILKQK